MYNNLSHEFLDLDTPRFKKYEKVSNRFKFTFILPEAENATIKFSLYEKESGDKEYSKFTKDESYEIGAAKDKKYEDSITFNKQLSSKYKCEYKIKGEIIKTCSNECMPARIFEFNETLVIGFPGKPI